MNLEQIFVKVYFIFKSESEFSYDHLEHEQNLHSELFHPHAKLPNAQIPIEMTGFRP